MTRNEVERKFENYELDDSYAKYIMDNCAGERLICNGETLICAMEDGYLYEEFINSLVGDGNECA